MLPDLEQNNLYAQLDFEKEPFESANSAYMASTVPVMLCPSDPHADSIHVSEFTSMGFARTNYLGTEDTGERPSGMLGYDGTNSFRDVVDGTSQTMFVGERGVDAAGEYGWWAWDPILGATPPFRRGDAEEAESRRRAGICSRRINSIGDKEYVSCDDSRKCFGESGPSVFVYW